MLPDALPRHPHAGESQPDIDDSFPDDFTSGSPEEFVDPRALQLARQRLSELRLERADTSVSVNTTMHSTPNPNRLADLATQKPFPFVDCAVITVTNLSAVQTETADR